MNDPIKLWRDGQSQRERRTKYYNQCYIYFEGDIFSQKEKERIEPDSFIETNYCEDYVEKYQSFLFPKNPRTLFFEVGVKSNNSDPNRRAKEEQDIIDVYRQTKFFSKLFDSTLDFLVAGCASFFFYPDTIDFKIEKVDPREVVLITKEDELVAVVFRRLYSEGTKSIEQFFALDKENIFVYENNKMIKKISHRLGLIPFAFLADRKRPHSMEGRSLLPSLVGMDKQITETLTFFGLRVGDNTYPELAIFSDKNIKKGDIKVGRKKIHQLGKDDDARYLEKKESSEPLDYCNFLEKRLLQKTSIMYSSGVAKNMISGVSLSIQFNDMMEAIAKKRVPWNDFFANLNTAILRWKNKNLNDYSTTPIYHSPLPLDITTKIDDTIKLIDASLISRADAVDEVRAVDDPKKTLEEIDEENKKYKINNYEPRNPKVPSFPRD